MKKCQCGKEVADNARACPHCGNRFTHAFVLILALAFGAFIIFAFIMAATMTR